MEIKLIVNFNNDKSYAKHVHVQEELIDNMEAALNETFKIFIKQIVQLQEEV